MADKFVLALCPTCERWQPSVRLEPTGLTRSCTLNIQGAPHQTVCDRYSSATGWAEILNWMQPDAETP